VLKQGQKHIDWYVGRRGDDEPESQGVEDEHMKRYRERRRKWAPKEQRSAQAEAWLRTLKT